MGYYHSYFVQAAAIWQNYFDGKITLTMRDGQLRYLKDKFGIK